MCVCKIDDFLAKSCLLRRAQDKRFRDNLLTKNHEYGVILQLISRL